MSEKTTNTLIIGASAAGLSCAACLKKAGVPYILIEQHGHVAHSWRNHYDRLHLNTNKKHSSLPFLPFPPHAPVFVSKQGVIQYLEEYARKMELHPEFHQKVNSLEAEGRYWKAVTTDRTYRAENIVIATGYNRQPFIPLWEGMNDFQGTILHSSQYKNGKPFKGKRVLVVGFGNSACEISICLHEHGARPSLSVKGAVNIIPRGQGNSKISNLFDSFAWVTKLTPRLIDSINAPFLRSRYGDLDRYGLQKLPYGPNVQILRHKQVPLLDIGTYDLIKKGCITVFPGISRFTAEGVYLVDGRYQQFDGVILGTGYRSAVSDFLRAATAVTDSEGRPLKSGVESGLSNLYFCGFYPSPLGMLREIGKEARKIAASIKRKTGTAQFSGFE